MTAISNSANGLLVTAPEPRQGTVPGIEGRGPHEQARRVQARRRTGRAERAGRAEIRRQGMEGAQTQSGLLEERMRAIL